ncbi:MAG: hypothetical protein A2234_04510 [Elusimicrobia bacterium RIFOXYA2_FULL_58_8]|nr:MAG: hypothetical protein A2285_03700 [Elusimicrobia bacterium RIFOXYA12_FULL_57_11]OGS15517.1 MAG: hypothetical protein A2234_04510 [Elusimicrobia bacterium RIFOXYA2_FULL_58_8]
MNIGLPHLTILVYLALYPAVRHAYAADTTPSPVIARVGDHAITEQQLNAATGMAIFAAQKQAYEAKTAWFMRKARALLFEKAAQDAKLSPAAWRAREIDGKIKLITDTDIENRALRLARGKLPEAQQQLADLKEAARNSLLEELLQARSDAIYRELALKTTLEFRLPYPEEPELSLYGAMNPAKGPKNAAVTIIEFTDFQCPWCGKAQPAIRELLEKNPDRLKLVVRHFPLTKIHPDAWQAAEAAVCMHEQRLFWPYHDKLFSNSGRLGSGDLATYAGESGADLALFNNCVKTRKYRDLVYEDQQDGIMFGVTGTPVFFVNNKKTSLTQLAETVQAALDDTQKSRKTLPF